MISFKKTKYLLLLFFYRIVIAIKGRETCYELVFDARIRAENKCTLSSYTELPYLNLSIDCNTGYLQWSQLQYNNSHTGNQINEIVLDYNCTNLPPGQSVNEAISRYIYVNSPPYQRVPERILNFSCSFGACLAFMGYGCWVLNEQRVSCNEDDQQFSSTPLQMMSSTLSTSSNHLYSSQPLNIPPTPQKWLSPSISHSIFPSQSSFNLSSSRTAVATGSKSSGPANFKSWLVITIPVLSVVVLSVVLGSFLLLMQKHNHLLAHFKRLSNGKFEDMDNNSDVLCAEDTLVKIDGLNSSITGSITTIIEDTNFTILKPSNYDETVPSELPNNFTYFFSECKEYQGRHISKTCCPEIASPLLLSARRIPNRPLEVKYPSISFRATNRGSMMDIQMCDNHMATSIGDNNSKDEKMTELAEDDQDIISIMSNGYINDANSITRSQECDDTINSAIYSGKPTDIDEFLRKSVLTTERNNLPYYNESSDDNSSIVACPV